VHDYLGIEPVFECPAPVLRSHHARGVEENAVEIEENGGAAEGRHDFGGCPQDVLFAEIFRGAMNGGTAVLWKIRDQNIYCLY
jgi:hypothetical protein